MPQVGILVGSASDKPVMEDTLKTLTDLGVEAELVVASAHRDPEKVRAYVLGAAERGIEVLIGAAGGAAALPGVIASYTTLPVIGVPIAPSERRGVDSLHSIAPIPPGVPVACVAVGAGGARQGGRRAAQKWEPTYDKIREAVEKHRQRLREA